MIHLYGLSDQLFLWMVHLCGLPDKLFLWMVHLCGLSDKLFLWMVHLCGLSDKLFLWMIHLNRQLKPLILFLRGINLWTDQPFGGLAQGNRYGDQFQENPVNPVNPVKKLPRRREYIFLGTNALITSRRKLQALWDAKGRSDAQRACAPSSPPASNWMS